MNYLPEASIFADVARKVKVSTLSGFFRDAKITEVITTNVNARTKYTA
jgi:hypothetical protein